MFVQIVITRTDAGDFKITFFDETGVVLVERMTDIGLSDTIYTWLQELRVPNNDIPR